MKVLLIKDVYKLGRAGDVKRVADGYGRNFLIPQKLAILATSGALKQVDRIKEKAVKVRALMNEEMSGLAEMINGVVLTFPSKAGETGKLYGSITNQMIVDAMNNKIGTSIDRRQVECQPIRNLGEHIAIVRLTVDLTPEVKIIVHREGEKPKLADETEEAEASSTEAVDETAAQVEAVAVEEVQDEVQVQDEE